MRLRLVHLCLLLGLWSVDCLQAATTGNIYKVLPFYLDRDGRQSLSPSLYERDAYQAYLRLHPTERAGLRFDINWKTRHAATTNLVLRIEVRSTGTHESAALVVERPVRPHLFSRWTSLRLPTDEYESFGQLVAWRATIWSGSELIAEQKSFLW